MEVDPATAVADVEIEDILLEEPSFCHVRCGLGDKTGASRSYWPVEHHNPIGVNVPHQLDNVIVPAVDALDAVVLLEELEFCLVLHIGFDIQVLVAGLLKNYSVGIRAEQLEALAT